MWFAFVTSVLILQFIEIHLFRLESSDDAERILSEWNQPRITTGLEIGQPVLLETGEKINAGKLIAHISGLAYDLHPCLPLQ